MNEAITTPKLRFPEFSGEWKSERIGEMFVFKNGLNKEKKFFGKGTPIINFNDVYHLSGINKSDIKGLVKLNNTEIERFIAKKGDVFFTRTSETIIDIGMSAVLIDDVEDCVFSGFTLRASPINDKLDLDFKKYCFSVHSVRKEIVTKSSYTTRALTSGTLLNKVIFRYPNSKVEQQKIAAFLTVVDKKIEQLCKNQELLDDYKKGLMQQIFSQAIRFKVDDGSKLPNWKEKKLGEIFEHRAEKNSKNELLLSITIKNGVIPHSKSNRKDSSSKDKSNYLAVYENDIAYNSMRMWQGASGVSLFNGIVSPAYTILKIKENDVSKFFGYMFKTETMIRIFQRNSQGLTPDTWNLKYPQLSKIKVYLPSVKEQAKITNLLSSLDSKIEQVEKQLDETKQFKKALLQQMFV